MPIEADDVDEDFLSQIEAAEFEALDQKRRRLSNNGGGSGGGGGGGGGETTPGQQQSLTNSTTSSSEGSYTAALKGSRSLVWQHALSTSNRSSVVVVTDSGTGSGDACFKCGKLGHWSRDCVNTGGGGGGGGGGGLGFGGNENVEEKACKCGLGVCLVLTANTEKNRGRKFYRCPAREENGGCGFFEWCDNSSATTVSNASQSATPKSLFPDVPCPCGAGLCLVLTAKTEKNMGQQFYRCPANQENACGFFKWCIERNSTASPQANTPKIFSNTNNSNNKGYGESRGSSCFKCGQDGHWARDCTGATSATSSVGGKSASSGECYKCGMSGHWSRDCQKPLSGSSVGVAGKSASSATCYKCYKSGHWAKDCPGQAQNVGRWP